MTPRDLNTLANRAQLALFAYEDVKNAFRAHPTVEVADQVDAARRAFETIEEELRKARSIARCRCGGRAVWYVWNEGFLCVRCIEEGMLIRLNTKGRV